MARLSPEKWEQARAEYEVRGCSLKELARKFGVSDIAVGKRARKEGWVQGKSLPLVDRKVAAIKVSAAVDAESSRLPQTFRHTIDTVVRERLQADGLLAEADCALAKRVIELAQAAETPDAVETLSRARRNLAPVLPRNGGTTVNVNQQQAQAIQTQSPKAVLEEIVEAAREDHD